MTDMLKHILTLLIAALLLMLISFVLGGKIGYDYGKATCGELPPADTTTIASVDSTTIGGTAVRPDADSLIRIDSVPYPVPYPVLVQGDTVHDTVYVYLSYEHRLFSIPDTLNVWYSGVDPRIDSINLYYHHTTEIVNHFVEVSKMPRLTAEIGLTVFYQDNRINPYAMAKIGYNAPKTTLSAYGAVDHQGRWVAGAGITYRFNIIK